MKETERYELLRVIYPELHGRQIRQVDEAAMCLQECQSRDDLQASIPVVIATFPKYFGLRSFEGPDGLFRLSAAGSYVNDHGVINLYTQVLIRGEWKDYAKGTPNELRAYMYELSTDQKATRLAEGMKR